MAKLTSNRFQPPHAVRTRTGSHYSNDNVLDMYTACLWLGMSLPKLLRLVKKQPALAQVGNDGVTLYLGEATLWWFKRGCPPKRRARI